MATVLITGSNRGIGLALVREFLRQGDQVFATARRPDSAAELQEILKGPEASKLHLQALDVTDPASVDQAARQVEKEVRRLHILINNAAVFPETGDERLEELDLACFEGAFATNVVGVARVTRAFLPLLRKSGEGRIANISSGAGSITDKTDSRYYCYSVSKAALNQLSRAIAAELRPEGIVVAPITPGWVKTAMGGENAELTAEESAASMARTIKKLTLKQSGLFLDRHGRSGVYNW